MSYKWHHNFPKIAREAGFTIRELSAGHCIDWRFIASIDPYGIVSEQDYEKLDEFIPHISEVPIGSVLNNRILDPAIGKYFILAQFSIQYLLFCKQFLDETVLEIRNTIQSLQEENARLEKMNKKRNEEVTLLHRKLQRVETMEHQHSQVTSVIYPCSKCTKNFISPELLSAHMVRKHATIVRPSETTAFDRKASTTDTNLINTIKLELEVKQLKERLNAAEKDLHNQRTKHHRCRVCSEDSSSATEKPPAKILHSVGIQSNLTDDKDLNDKEAQTQTDTQLAVESGAVPTIQPKEPVHSADLISKSDLQSFLEQQKLLFESWKTSERQTLNREIATVKQNLDDVILNMERSERNTPVPEVEDAIWKVRYKELEKMYEVSQKQTQQAIGSFEQAYTQKMEQIEKLLLQARPLEQNTTNTPDTAVTHVSQRVSNNSTGLKVITLPTIAIESESLTDHTKVMNETISHSQVVMSSESEQAESDEDIGHAIEVVGKHQPTLKAPHHSIAAAIQEPFKDTKPPVQSSQSALLISPKKQILAQFRARLKAIGVDPKSKQLFGDHLNAACKALADRREVQKQKHNHFFITRNQLLSKVDQLTRIKVDETPPAKGVVRKMSVDQPILTRKGMHPTSAKAPTTQPRLKASSALDLLPSKQKLHLPEMISTVESTDLNVFKGKTTLPPPGTQKPSYRPTIKLTDDDIITVHADMTHLSGAEEPTTTLPNMSKRASFSSYDQHVERLLHTPIKSIHPAIAIGKVQNHTHGLLSQENPPDTSGAHDGMSIQPKPVPKKRVLFNLDKADYIQSTGTSAPAGQQQTTEEYLRIQKKIEHQNVKVDDESDWNISSFDEDK
ncbi:cilium assembly protein DZIP1L [Anopheles marshallii]|uniref:cilium assembly protein DZIP1L n=1 Tax=Anopheles marshallii TaxID=1521116 RepID=UPI00237B3CAA|nr:cilium assembly protein DZIP1L [Anopheles marshallii]